MNNALDIHKREGMNVAHLQGGNLGDGGVWQYWRFGGRDDLLLRNRGTSLSIPLEIQKFLTVL